MASAFSCVCALGGAAYALLLVYGWQIEHLGGSRPGALWVALLLWPLLALLLARLFALRLPGRAPLRPARFSVRRSLLFLLLCWLPSYLIHFPGSFAYDAPYQLTQVATGVYSTHHPLLSTLALGGCVLLGRALGSITLGAALYSALQAAFLALFFALTLSSIARQASPGRARLAALFFALYPTHMLMAVNATKDVLFSGAFVLLLALCREALAQGLTPRRCALLGLCAMLTVLLRNNMTYALLPFLLLLCLARRARLSGILALGLGVALLLGTVLSTALRATPGDPREMLSWPIQQLARVRLRTPETLNASEIEQIDALMPHQAWQHYDPTVSDNVKFHFDTQRALEDPAGFAALCLRVLAAAPRESLDAILCLTHGFLYPYRAYRVSGPYLQTGITPWRYPDWEETIEDRSPLPRLRASIAWRFGAKGAMQIPLVGWAFNMGGIVWLLLFFVLRGLAMRPRGAGLAGVLPLLLLATFLLGPVMAGRYLYPFLCALPVVSIPAGARDMQKE